MAAPPTAKHPTACLDAIESLLKDHIGLNVASIGSSSVMHAVQRRMGACGYDDMAAYHKELRSNQAELTQLIETVVVPETWFFRAQHAFDALAQFSHDWLAQHPQQVLRILSVPCSTGEEPYSIAMTLLNQEVDPNRFHIDAVDISARHIRHAQQGLYGANSFRCEDLRFRDRYFNPAGRVFKLDEAVMRAVNFGVANLLDANFCTNRAPYQVVFCRNLLIYFDKPTQQQAIETIDRLLTPDGVLFLGHAEGGVVRHMLYDSARFPMAFAFRRGNDDRRAPGEDRREVLPTGAAQPERRRRPERRHPPVKPTFPQSVPVPSIVVTPAPDTTQSAEPTATLDLARAAADAGRLDEATRLCEEVLRQAGASCAAYYLLAVIRDAAGDKAQSEALLRKALYLDPQHYPSLSQLALLLERRGDHEQAARLRDRAERSKPADVETLLRAVP